MPRALFPEVAEERFGGGAAVGWLFAAIAIGSMIGGLTSGWIGRVRRQGLALVCAVVAWGLAVALAGLAHSLWLMVVLLAVAGAADLVSAVFRQSILLVYAPDAMRGRLQGVMTVVVAGGPRLGDLRAGAMAAAWGVSVAWVGGGVAAAVVAVVLALAFPRWSGTAAPTARRGAGTDIVARMSTPASDPRPPSGTQWTIAAGGHEAVVVEVGGGLRAYRADGVDYLDGYGEDEICPGGAGTGPGAVAEPDPRRPVHLRRRVAPAGADRAGPAQRDPRAGQLGRAGGRSTVAPDAVTRRARPAAAARATRGRCGCARTWSVGADGLRATHEATNLGDRAVPVRVRRPPVPAAARRRRRRPRAAACPRAAGCWSTAGCCRSARPEGGRRRVRLHRARAGSARPCSTPRSATSTATRDGGSTRRASPRRTAARSRVWADAAFGWWQVFTGDTLHGERHRRSVAVEPMTCPPDAFRSGRDLIVLEPGRPGAATWGIIACGSRSGEATRMEFDDVVRRRRMVRNYDPDRPVPAEVVRPAARPRDPGAVGRLLAGLGLPGAGRRRPTGTRFWAATTPEDWRLAAAGWTGMRRAPLIVVPHSNQSAYLDRYAEPDKGWTDRDEARWPVPYWHIDTGFASLLMLLTAVDEGLGACFFGIPPERTRRLPGGVRRAGGVHPDRRGHDRLPRHPTTGRRR